MTTPGRRWGRLQGQGHRPCRAGPAGTPGIGPGRPGGPARAVSTAVVITLAAATLAAVTLAAGAPAGAQLIFPTTTTTTTITPPPPTAAPDPEPPEPITTTTAPPAAPVAPDDSVPPSPDVPPPAEAGPAPDAPPAADAASPAGVASPAPPVVPPSAPVDGRGPARPATLAPGELPPGARNVIGSVRRSAANSTRRILAALVPLEQLGMTHEEAVAAGFGRFPVGGSATFSHDWLFPRFTPTFHLHQGTDIFAAAGTPVRAPADGVLKLAQGGSGGLAVYVYQADGTYYYMAHLSAFAGQKPGQRVVLGEVVGYVGDTGNARGGSPHVHFEIHPAPARAVTSGKGRNRTVTYVARPVPVGTVLPAVDPKATLDLWLREALAAVPQLVAVRESGPGALAATGVTGRRPDAFPAPVVPPSSRLLWASSVNPSGGALRLAEAEAMVVAAEFDWSQASRRQQALAQDQADAVARTAAILAPLTPPSLLPTLSNDA